MTTKNGDQHSCAAFWVRGVAEMLKAKGLDVAALFDEAGLEMVTVNNAGHFLPLDRPSELRELIIRFARG